MSRKSQGGGKFPCLSCATIQNDQWSLGLPALTFACVGQKSSISGCRTQLPGDLKGRETLYCLKCQAVRYNDQRWELLCWILIWLLGLSLWHQLLNYSNWYFNKASYHLCYWWSALGDDLFVWTDLKGNSLSLELGTGRNGTRQRYLLCDCSAARKQNSKMLLRGIIQDSSGGFFFFQREL